MRWFITKRQALGHCWWLAPGGGLDPDETFEDAARRELREETGRDVRVLRVMPTEAIRAER